MNDVIAHMSASNVQAALNPPLVTVIGFALQVFTGSPCVTHGARVGYASAANFPTRDNYVNAFFLQNVQNGSSLVFSNLNLDFTQSNAYTLTQISGNTWGADIQGYFLGNIDFSSRQACVSETGMIVDRTVTPLSGYRLTNGDSRNFYFGGTNGHFYTAENDAHTDYACGVAPCFNGAFYSGKTIWQYNLNP